MHKVDVRVQRVENIRRLGLIAKSLELGLVKTDEETGERQLDKSSVQDLSKIIKQQSDEFVRLAEAEGKTKTSASRNA